MPSLEIHHLPAVGIHKPAMNQEIDVIVPLGVLRGLRGTCGALKEWIRGRYRLAREREDRATMKLILHDLREGDIWLDRDGERLRLVIKSTNLPDGDIQPQLDPASQSLQPEHGNDATRTDAINRALILYRYLDQIMKPGWREPSGEDRTEI